MPARGATAAATGPRRARYLIPRDLPRRADLIAGLITAALIGQLLFAQLTLAFAAALYLTGRLVRWRWTWLTVPAGVGLAWALAIGPAAAVSGLLAGPRQVAAYLAGVPGEPSRLLHLGTAFAGAGTWLPRQLPLALVLGAAEAAFLAWLDWLHTDAEAVRPARTGLIVAARRRYTRRAIRAGGVLTRDGSRLGVAADGRSAAVSWAEAEGGVLVAGREPVSAGPTTSRSWRAAALFSRRATRRDEGAPRSEEGRQRGQTGGLARAASTVGPPGPGPSATGFRFVHAAIRRRKPVVVVDLAGQRGWLAGALAAVGTAAGAPLYEFGPAGPGYYDPLRTGDPARATALLTGLLDWSGGPDWRQRGCAAYLTELFAIRRAAPPHADQPVLADVTGLLDPAALAARLRQVPSHHPHRAAMATRLASVTALTKADPGGLADVAGQLARLTAAPAGRWLGRGREQLGLGRILRERAVGLFALDPAEHGPAAAMIGRLVLADALALCADLRAMGVSGDAVAWFSGCEQLPSVALAELVAAGYRAGLTVVLSTTSVGAAASLAGAVNVLALHPVGDEAAAAELAGLASAQHGTGPLAAVSTAQAPAAAAGAGPAGARGRAAAAGWRPGTGPELPPAPRPQPVPAWAQRVPAPEPSGTWTARGPGAPAADPAEVAGPAPPAPYPVINGTDVPPAALLSPRGEELALIVKGPRRRVRTGCRAVPAELPGRPG